MQRTKRLLFVLFAFVMLFGLVPVSADALTMYAVNPNTGYEDRIYDEAGLFSKDEINRLYEEAYEITEYSNIVIATINHNPYGYSESSTKYEFLYAEGLYDSFYGLNSDRKYENGIVFLIDMDTRWLYIYRDGDITGYLTEGKCDSITDNAYSYASSGDYYKCASKVIEQLNSVVQGRAIFEPMKLISNLFIGLSLSFLITYLIASAQSKAKLASGSDMLQYAEKSFYSTPVNDVLTSTTKVYCPPSSSSGGGGHRGGGGGGHHGGGGGHRF